MTPNPRRQDAALDRLYEQVPVVHCKGHWHGACCFIGATVREQQRIEQATGRKLETIDSRVEMTDRPRGVVHPVVADLDRHGSPLARWRCTMLDPDGTCAGYDNRPMICRLYGAADHMECGYGCEVEGTPLRLEEGLALVALTDHVGGGHGPVVNNSREMMLQAPEAFASHAEDVLDLVGWLLQ